MNINNPPGGQDAALKNENAITVSASESGQAFDFGSGFAPSGVGQPLNAVVDVSAFALGGSAGASTITATLTEGTSATGTFTSCGADVKITATGVIAVPGIVSQRYAALKITIAGATGTGTVTLSSWLNPKGFAAAR